jgi:3-hydroxymyristoyl/3-hydroxydecanoyl-(acyl carrier protein) dehydratase
MPSNDHQWLPLGEALVTPSDGLETTVRLDPSSRWFSGHFDECPVVPGVAILAFVAETVTRQSRRQGRNLVVSGFFRVRFRRVVFPGESLHISVASMPAGPEAELPFEVTCGSESVAQGVLKVKDTWEKGHASGKGDERTVERAQDQDC